jgi:hypothetical protein
MEVRATVLVPSCVHRSDLNHVSPILSISTRVFDAHSTIRRLSVRETVGSHLHLDYLFCMVACCMRGNVIHGTMCQCYGSTDDIAIWQWGTRRYFSCDLLPVYMDHTIAKWNNGVCMVVFRMKYIHTPIPLQRTWYLRQPILFRHSVPPTYIIPL